MNRRFLLLGAGAAVVAGGAYFLMQPQGGAPVATAPDVSGGTGNAAAIADITMGDPNAEVTVVEYASFTCPHCKTFHETTFNQLKENYIDTGKVHFIYREVYFDRFGLWAAIVARCGGPERYFGIADLIYQQQREWTSGGDPAIIADNLRTIGKTAGLTDAELDACLSDADLAENLVAAYQAHAERDGINSTPSFLINGQRHGNMSYADFAALIDEELSG